MNRHLVDLYLQQGRLLERVAVQRADLRRQIEPIHRATQFADSALVALKQTMQTLQSNPLLVTTAVVMLFLLKPRRAWTWGIKGLRLWRNWQRLQKGLSLHHLWR